MYGARGDGDLAGSLEIEITETALMGGSSGHDNVVERLRARGLRIAIDDFGTGYSSLLYLRRFPVDRIKVAQEFVKDIGIEPNDTAIVKAAIGLARELGIGVMAEGVETADQAQLLHEWGCRQAQGFTSPRQCRRKMFYRCYALAASCVGGLPRRTPPNGRGGCSCQVKGSILLLKAVRRIKYKGRNFDNTGPRSGHPTYPAVPFGTATSDPKRRFTALGDNQVFAVNRKSWERTHTGMIESSA